MAVGALLLGGVVYVLVARPRITQWGATDQEHQAAWPGDQLVARPGCVWTNAITIHAPAAQVWPWLVQLGQGRGGLYSYDWLENLIGCDVHSTDRILSQFQQPLRVGDRVIRMARYAPLTRWRWSGRTGPWSWAISRTPMLSWPPVRWTPPLAVLEHSQPLRCPAG